MAISKAKDPSVMMFPSDFLLLLALLREVVDRAHGGHKGLHLLKRFTKLIPQNEKLSYRKQKKLNFVL